jgi:hypothetical protein
MLVHVPGVTSRFAPPGQNFPFIDALDKKSQKETDVHNQKKNNLQNGQLQERKTQTLERIYYGESEIQGFRGPDPGATWIQDPRFEREKSSNGRTDDNVLKFQPVAEKSLTLAEEEGRFTLTGSAEELQRFHAEETQAADDMVDDNNKEDIIIVSDDLEQTRIVGLNSECAGSKKGGVGVLSTDALVEAVDLYATISELAGLPVPTLCPNVSLTLPFCTEGVSLIPLIRSVVTSSSYDVTSSSYDVIDENEDVIIGSYYDDTDTNFLRKETLVRNAQIVTPKKELHR